MARAANFAKMNGLGNAIIVADMRARTDMITASAAIALHGDGNGPTAFDQIMEIRDPVTNSTDAFIRILNSDGTEAGACGNGTRCVVQALAQDTGKRAFQFETIAGLLNAEERDGGLISVDMGPPRFDWQQIPVTHDVGDTKAIELENGPLKAPSLVNMGNPHAVFWVDSDVWSFDMEALGPPLETHALFPDRANISIAQVVNREHIILRTWERGAGLTLACGSAACATLVAASRLDMTDRAATVTVPGGDLHIAWRQDNHVIMTGPAEWEFDGTLDPETGEWARREEQVA